MHQAVLLELSMEGKLTRSMEGSNSQAFKAGVYLCLKEAIAGLFNTFDFSST
jgi:hypothetical protein